MQHANNDKEDCITQKLLSVRETDPKHYEGITERKVEIDGLRRCFEDVVKQLKAMKETASAFAPT